MEDTHGGDVWKAASLYGMEVEELLDFSANLNPLGPPRAVVDLLEKRARMIAYYPAPHGREFKEALCMSKGLSPTRVIVGNGAAELIYLFFAAIRPGRVLIVAPTFTTYARAAKAVGSLVDHFILNPDDDFGLPIKEVVRQLEVGYQAVVLCNPNNPTGRLYSTQEVAVLVKAAVRRGVFTLVDESFFGLVSDSDLKAASAESALSLALQQSGDSVFLLSSMTKVFALPGLRLGYGIGPSELIAAMEKLRDPWSVNTLAQHAGRLCLEEHSYVSQSVLEIARAREVLVKGLSAIPGITVFPAAANFVLCRLNQEGVTAANLEERLARKGILIRTCMDFVGLDERYFRVAVRKAEENELLVKVLRRFLDENGGGYDYGMSL